MTLLTKAFAIAFAISLAEMAYHMWEEVFTCDSDQTWGMRFFALFIALLNSVGAILLAAYGMGGKL